MLKQWIGSLGSAPRHPSPSPDPYHKLPIKVGKGQKALFKQNRITGLAVNLSSAFRFFSFVSFQIRTRRRAANCRLGLFLLSAFQLSQILVSHRCRGRDSSGVHIALRVDLHPGHCGTRVFLPLRGDLGSIVPSSHRVLLLATTDRIPRAPLSYASLVVVDTILCVEGRGCCCRVAAPEPQGHGRIVRERLWRHASNVGFPPCHP